MSVAVIVPAFNYGRFIAEALQSVAAQTYTEWECIVVDDGSTDDTAAVVQRFVERDGRFRYLHQQNSGVSAARNAGLRASRSSYVQFLDADDRLAPEKLRRHVDYLEQHPLTDIVYGEVTFFRTEEPERVLYSLQGQLSRPVMAHVHGVEEALQKLQHYNMMPVLAALLRRDVLARVGEFDERARGSEDWAFWLRCALTGCRFDFDDQAEPVAMVRTHAESLSRDTREMLRGLIASAREFEALHADTPKPLIFDYALGVDTVLRGARVAGVRAMWSAASRATETLTSIRWRIYALAMLTLPRAIALRFITMPIPERLFEWYRRLR